MEVNLRVVLTAITVEEEKQAVAAMTSAILNVSQAEVLNAFDKLPAVIFDNVDAEVLKKLKDSLIFLSKLGMDFTVTVKPVPELPRTNWPLTQTPPVMLCPNCGEELLLLRARNFQQYHRSQPIDTVPSLQAPSFASTSDFDGISSELEEVEMLSEELEAFVQHEEEEIEEVESVSEEMRKLGNISSIEGIGGISAEFEEIEGVSAEFERMCLGGLDSDIGSLSAELEEIGGISTELDSFESRLDMEKIGAKTDSLQKIGTGAMKTMSRFEDSADYELEELEEISAELEKVAEPLQEEVEKTEPIGPKKTLMKSKAKPAVPEKKPVRKKSAKTAAMQFPAGNYNVTINFSGPGNIQGGAQLLAKIKGITIEAVLKRVENHRAVTIMQNISKDSAEVILDQFKKLKMQGKIAPARKRK